MTDEQAAETTGGLPRRPEPHALGLGQVDQLASVVLELAAQLHVERTRVRRLEHILCRSGLLTEDALAEGIPAELAGELREELNGTLADLLSTPAERDDARAPMRDAPPETRHAEPNPSEC